jgi:putative transposase
MHKVTMQKHPQSIRLKNHNYASSGAYFVTICAAQKMHLFREVNDAQMELNKSGKIVLESWNALPHHFSNTQIDQFIFMPNHVHGILWLNQRVRGTHSPFAVGAQHAAPLHGAPPRVNVEPGSLGAVIRSFKSAVTKRINEARATPGVPVWPRNYYEHIVRNDTDLERIRTYIENNPAQWALDDLNTAVQA